MLDWELRDPWFLLLLGFVPITYYLASRPRSLMTFSSLRLTQKTVRSWRARLSFLPALLLSLAVACLAIAMSRPRTPQSESRIAREGIAIQMVVDLSSSMDARDLAPDDRSRNRLSVVKEVFLQFVLGDGEMSGRPDDLIGLVTFAGYADSVCPLTLDHANLAAMVKDLQLVSRQDEDGTAIGDGLGLAVERLRRSRAKSRVAILLTDGVTTAGVIEPMKGAELAAEHGVKVYCIGAGTNGTAPVPATDFFGRPTLVAQRVEIDEETLKQIADRTGGRYFRAVDKDSLTRIYQDIDQLERVEVSEMRYLQYTEHYSHFVLSALGLMGSGLLLGVTLFRRLP